MSSAGAREAWKAERRRVFREHHPDMGGDTDSLIAALAAVDAKYGFSSAAGQQKSEPGKPVVHVFSTAGPIDVVRQAVLHAVDFIVSKARRRTYFDI